MAIVAERVGLNPPAEDPTVQSLDFVGLDPSWGVYLLGHDYPAPQPETIHSGSADTEGDPVVQTKWGNRTITVKVRAFEPPDLAAENRIANPSGEENATGLNTSTEVTLARTVDPLGTPLGLNLDTYFLVESKANAKVTYWPTMALAAGEQVTFTAYVKVLSRTEVSQARITIRNETRGAVLATGTNTAATAIGEYVRLTVTYTAAGAEVVTPCVEQTGAGIIKWAMTAAQFEKGAAATHYFDGDTPGCDWAGPRNASASTRPAPDGTRFSRICRDITRQIDKIRRTKQGVLRRISAQGGPMYYDLRVGAIAEAPTALDIQRKRAEYGLSFEALPGGRTPEQLLTTKEELTLPVLSVLLENVPGEMAALGRVVLTDKQGFNQRAAWWGLEQTYYSAAASAEPFYEAETRTLLGGTVVEGAPAGASGNKCVKSIGLLTEAQSIISTQATGGGAQLSHAGSFRLLARVQVPATNTGAVTVGFNYASGDFINTQESASTVITGNKGKWQIVELGVLNIPQAAPGTAQRWEGRFTAKSTVTNDVLYIDGFVLLPATDGSGKASALSVVPGLPPVVGYDDFPTLGALAGKAARVGGNWAGAGSATDFTVEETVSSGVGITQPVAGRKAISDAANVPRYAILGATESEAIELTWTVGVQQNGAVSGWEGGNYGAFARYINPENWLAFTLGSWFSGSGGTMSFYMLVRKRVAGVITTIGSSFWGFFVPVGIGTSYYLYRCKAYALADGSFYMNIFDNYWNYGFNIYNFVSGQDADLVAGTGALKKGKVGLFDEHTSAKNVNREYDAFTAKAPLSDAVMYANRGFELRSDRVRRESSDGATFGSVGNYEGDYLLIPPAGPEKRSSRLVAKGSRNPSSDDGIDDLKAQIYVTPRYLQAAPY